MKSLTSELDRSYLCETPNKIHGHLVCSCSIYIYTPGSVVRTLVSANLGLNFNLGFFFLLPKAVSRIIFSILFRVSNHQIVGDEN